MLFSLLAYLPAIGGYGGCETSSMAAVEKYSRRRGEPQIAAAS